MALIRNGTRDTARVQQMIGRLAQEIRGGVTSAPVVQPIIYENRIGQSQSFHVTVIWDEWDDLPLQARSRIILDAYEQADPSMIGRITIAMGLTSEDGGTLGFYPFVVIPMLKRADEPLRERIGEAMRTAGAKEDAHGLKLRFRTLEEADQALAQLQSQVPGPFFALVQELDRDS